MQASKAIIKSVRKELLELDKKLENLAQLETLNSLQVNQAIEYLNEALRTFDHAVEHLSNTQE